MQDANYILKYQICGHVGVLAGGYIIIDVVLTFKFTIIQ